MSRIKPADKAIIMLHTDCYMLCTKFGIDADNVINYFKKALPNCIFLAVTKSDYIQTQWDNRKLKRTPTT